VLLIIIKLLDTFPTSRAVKYQVLSSYYRRIIGIIGGGGGGGGVQTVPSVPELLIWRVSILSITSSSVVITTSLLHRCCSWLCSLHGGTNYPRYYYHKLTWDDITVGCSYRCSANCYGGKTGVLCLYIIAICLYLHFTMYGMIHAHSLV